MGFGKIADKNAKGYVKWQKIFIFLLKKLCWHCIEVERTEAIPKKWINKEWTHWKKDDRFVYVHECVCVSAFCVNFDKNLEQFQFKYKTMAII